jgi:putative ABC transport system permease protein
VEGSAVSPGYFRLLGVDAALGRALNPGDSEAGRREVAVLGYGLWQGRYGGDPDVIGRSIELNGTSHTIVGVMPPEFEGIRFKPRVTAFVSDWITPQDLWVPIPLDESAREATGRSLFVLGRLKGGVSLEQARAEMTRISQQLAEEHEYDVGWSTQVFSLHDQVVGEAGRALGVLLGAVGLILLIACVNVANILLARGTARRREIAVRAALGGARRRIVRQLLTESSILATLGGLFGFLLAIWGVDVLTALAPGDIPRLEDVGVSIPVLIFTALATISSALLFGLLPAVQASRPDVQESLKEGGRGSTESAGRRTRGGLVVAEVALAALLVIGASLIVRSFWALVRVDPGFDAENVVSATLTLRGERYNEDDRRVAFTERLLKRVRALPGVTAAAVTVARPLGGGVAPATSFRATDRPEPAVGEWPVTDVRMVSPGYFRTMGISLQRGRDFEAADDADAPPVVIVNETLARTFWPEEDPIGKRLIVRMGDETPREIVGVVDDVRHSSLDAPVRAQVYYPHAQLSFPWLDLVVRSSMAPAALVGTLQREVRALDPELPLYSVKPMEEVVSESLAGERFNMLLLALFALLALLLAGIGIYGVLSYAVSRRTHEIGIRLALGSERPVVLRSVIAQGMGLAALGLLIGVGAAFLLTGLLSDLLYEVGARDPLTFIVVTAALAAAALLACLVPALRATRIDPMVALRYE